jgi:hypothetical protein
MEVTNTAETKMDCTNNNDGTNNEENKELLPLISKQDLLKFQESINVSIQKLEESFKTELELINKGLTQIPGILKRIESVEKDLEKTRESSSKVNGSLLMKEEKVEKCVENIQKMDKLIKNKYERTTSFINKLEQIINEKIGLIDSKVDSMWRDSNKKHLSVDNKINQMESMIKEISTVSIYEHPEDLIKQH